jgi:cyclopropane fatty-acyl-phospholipid synthase-like methyltransferase
VVALERSLLALRVTAVASPDGGHGFSCRSVAADPAHEVTFPVRVSAAQGGSLASAAGLGACEPDPDGGPPDGGTEAEIGGRARLPVQLLVTTWRDGGPAGSARKLSAAIRLALPVLMRGRRTAAGVGAYFDLITDDARLFYGDNFHVGYFRPGSETLAEALDAHTDLVGEMARLQTSQRVLDVGCGIGAPALRIAERYGCQITGVNISREQVRQGRRLIEERRMSHRVKIVRGDVRAIDFPDGSFDAIVCLEAAGDICVTELDKDRLVRGLHRVLRPGGHVGFSDLALRARPSQQEDHVLRAVLYHSGAELVTDWPALFVRHGFTIVDRRDIITDTIATWDRVRTVYEERRDEAVHRYGHRLARRIRAQIDLIPEILAKYATFPVFSALK